MIPSTRECRFFRAARLASAFFLLASTAEISSALAEPFYKDKIIRVLINFPAGGAADLEGRLFARYLGKNIESAPSVVGFNMGGAGGMVGTNYLGTKAPKDGTMLGYLTGVGGLSTLHPELFRVNFREYNVVGYSPGGAIYYVRTNVSPGVRQPSDLLNARIVQSGGISASSNKDLYIRMTLDMLGVKYNHVTGYMGSGPMLLAFQRGEVNFISDGRASYDQLIKPQLIEVGEAIPVYSDPSFDGENISANKNFSDLPIKPFQEFYKDVKGRYPEGQLWEMYLTLLGANQTLQRVILLPPGVPQEALEILSSAINQLNEMSEFNSDAQQALGFVPEYFTGREISETVRKLTEVKPAIRRSLNDYIKAASP